MTKLNRWFDMTNEGEVYPTYTRDSWEVPDGGSEIWCTAWHRGQTIKPHGDGCHVVVGFTIYHCDELMGILNRLSAEGHSWGIENVSPTREQRKNSYWVPVKINSQLKEVSNA